MSATKRFSSRISSRLAILLIPLLLLAVALPFAAPQKAYAGGPVYIDVQASPSGSVYLEVNGMSYGWKDAPASHSIMVSDGDDITVEVQFGQYEYLVGWFEANEGHYIADSVTYSFKASDDVNLTAEVQPINYYMIASAWPASDGSVYCGSLASYWDSWHEGYIAGGTYTAVEADPIPGYRFVGWYDDGDNWVSGDNPYYFTMDGDRALYAWFEQIPTYTITFDVNDASMGEISYSNVASGSTWEEGTWIKLEAYAYTDYYFCGWVADGWPASSSDCYEFQLFSDTNLTAIFDSIYAERTIVTMPGEGSGWMPDYTVTTGHDFELPECTFDPPEGKEFDEWDVGPAGKVITVNSDMTITALWKDLPAYTVHIEPNGGGGWIADPDITWGTWWTLPDNPFDAPEGQEFDKWDAGYPGEQILIEGETWIYAQWKDVIPKYTIYIQPNGGTGYMPDPQVEAGSTYTLPACGFDPPEGKVFDRWDLGAPGTVITVNGDITINALWKDPVKIAYSCTLGNKATWKSGSNAMLSFTFKRNVDDNETFSHFADGKGSVKVDGQLLDPSQYTAISGSLMLTFSPNYLQTLAYGTHSLEVTFDDGVATTSFTTVQEAEKGGGASGDSDGLPTSTLVLGGVCAVLLGVIIGMLVRRKSDKSGSHAR